MDETVADLRAGIERRLSSLESYSLKQLAACNGPLDLHAELVDEIRQEAAVIDGQLEVGSGPPSSAQIWSRLDSGSLRRTSHVRWTTFRAYTGTRTAR